MGYQFDSITTAPDCSLTFIVNDIIARGRENAAQADIEAWLNALSRQAVPMVASKAGRAQLEAWLDAADAL
jgi:hypothetical protein